MRIILASGMGEMVRTELVDREDCCYDDGQRNRFVRSRGGYSPAGIVHGKLMIK